MVDPDRSQYDSGSELMLYSFFLEFFIALRYLRGQGRTVIFSLGTRLSFLFMSLMVFIMVVVLSVFTGFQAEVHRSLWNSGYHVTITRQGSGKMIKEYEEVVAAVIQSPSVGEQVKSAFGSISINALLEQNNRFEGKGIRAIPVYEEDIPTGQLRDFPRIVHYNKDMLQDFDYGNYVIVGREMARYYGWQVGDRIRLLMPQGGSLGRNMRVLQDEFVIAGFFRTGYYEFDLNLIFMSLNTAQRVLFSGDAVTEVIVQMKDLSNMDAVKSGVRESLPGNSFMYNVYTIKDERGNFLAALQLEKTLMVIIMGLLIVAGIAGIWVTVHLLVQSKNRSIGMLRAMGLPMNSVIVIFTAHSMLIGLLSTAIGGSLGIFTANRLENIITLAEETVNGACDAVAGNCVPVQFIPKNIYYFDHLPVYADMNIIFGVALTTMILSGLAGYFPSRKAAKLDPVRTIRND